MPDLHRAAADLYLDSYPFCSPTSMLESAVLGTPVVAFQPDPQETGILYSECPWLSPNAYTADTPQGVVDLVEALVQDSHLRQEISEAIDQAWPSICRMRGGRR